LENNTIIINSRGVILLKAEVKESIGVGAVLKDVEMPVFHKDIC
jgi:hypothetical protein